LRWQLKFFLVGDAAACAQAGQKLPQGCYNIGGMLGMGASGYGENGFAEGVHRSTLDEMTAWTHRADKALVFLSEATPWDAPLWF
jgi:uncharacterized protein involved in oxidation of intracellular sulfur